MLYFLLLKLVEEFSFLNVFKYITFRSAIAILTSLIVCFLMGGRFINFLKVWQKDGQPIRDDGPQTHLSKKGTPTMGGLMILTSVTISTLLWADITNGFVWIILFVMIAFGCLGFVDDYRKIKYKNSKGVPGKIKLLWQFFIGGIAAYFISILSPQGYQTHLAFPFFKNLLLNLGIFYFIFASVVITGASNAVNLTDGLDGLATGPVILASICYALISYITGNVLFSEYLQIHSIPNSGEITVLCSAIIGASLGFLWYNAPPAQIFMGDVGSLALGSAIGVISVITKHEIVLAIIGGLFVMEAVSVILQVFSYKTTGKRIFKMAPIHHHFEKLGWSETKVVFRFWIIAFIFALLGLSTLKLR